MNILSILLLLVAVVTAILGCVVIFSRKRQAQGKADKARGKASEEEQRREGEKETVRRAEEEERQRVEAQRQIEELLKPEEEQRRREADEAGRKAEESQVAEEEDRISEEEGMRLGEEEHDKAREVQPEVETERNRSEPSKRGGRPRASNQDRETKQLQEGKPRRPKPEIICLKRERQWIPAVEIPEELFESPNLTVLQNGLPLIQDESREGCWRFNEVCGHVVVHWNEDEVARIELGEESYLLFKLSGQHQNKGRRVKSPSFGSYLVTVPDNWERYDTLSGPPPVTPESVSLTGYRAHFFELEKGSESKIAFLIPTGKSFIIESEEPRFELVGNRLNEASGDRGPLFGERPPQIRARDDQTWKNVGAIVVGEEGSGKGRWRKPFKPVTEGMQQDLPSEVTDRKGGWYFIRFYDMNDDLIESLDFRFICSLKEIRILQPSLLPSEDGHGLVRVAFLHEPGCTVQPVDNNTNIQIESQDDKTTLTIPPDPTYDETRWLLGPEGEPQVEATILVERLWWGIGEEHNAPSEWEDQPLTLSRDDFAETSKKALWLRLPKRRWTSELFVGFERSRADRCLIQATKRDVTKPLREFVTFKEITYPEHEYLLKLWIECKSGFIEGVVAVIPAALPIVVPIERLESEAQKEQVQQILLLNLDAILARRLATMLTCLRRNTVGPLRALIKEVRQMYFRGRPAWQVDSMEFKRHALCMIALTLELRPQIPGFKNRRAVRAQLARDEFPEIMSRLRNRYKEINTSRSYRAGSICDGRWTA